MNPQTAPWLHIIGIGDNGLDSLSEVSRDVLESAKTIFGAERHHALISELAGERRAWPSPFNALIGDLEKLRGTPTVVLATGDPLWYSVGARIGRDIDPAEIVYHPQLSAFQLAASRLGWSLADCETLTIHGRPTEQMIPFVLHGKRLLILTKDASSPQKAAEILRRLNYGASRITVLAHLGGEGEARFDGTVKNWSHDVPDFHTLAVECIADEGAAILPRTGLPDSAFATDGNMTKRDVRAITLAKLAPARGALLWDIGCGSGSVAIEWMRAARDARAIGIESREDRRAFAAQNAVTLGAPTLRLIEGCAPDALDGLPAPDAIFIGGGVSDEVVETAWKNLKPFGRLVANVVTLEGEVVLHAQFQKYGGELTRIGVEQARAVGTLTGWKPAMTVTQWSITK